MIFIFGEKVRAGSTSVGTRPCASCGSEQPFTEQRETLWFTFFMLPVLPIEESARFWRCETCCSAYRVGELKQPSCVPLVKRICIYLLLGYNRHEHLELAQEICFKLTGFTLEEEEAKSLVREIAAGQVDMVEEVRSAAPDINDQGRRLIIEAAFLTTHACCDLQYEDRLRVNQIGAALGAGLNLVELVIRQARSRNYHGVRRLVRAGAEA